MHHTAIDFTGQRFGKLTVIRATTKRSSRSVVWECLCDCGKATIVSSRHLRSGNTASCGCLRCIDLSGRRFGRLKALYRLSKRSGKRTVWRCQCDCGNVAFVITNYLLSGSTASCGCLYRDTRHLSKLDKENKNDTTRV